VRSNPWAEQVSSYLDAAVNLKVTTSPESKRAHQELLNNIIESIQAAANHMNIEANMEVRELEVPDIKGQLA
jgi:glucose-6-phosphate-specific signal transduction histidine kinase